MDASADLVLSIIFVILLSGVESHGIEVFVNDTVSIRCSPNRSVDIQWHHNSDLNYVYAGRRFFLPYKGRFRLEKVATTGDYDLIIPNVTLEDAGWYLCQEELSGHRISKTQLTVLYVNPVCSSNMPSDGFVGPNTCGLQTENMTFSCDVKFNGKPPYVIWRSANDSQTFCSSSCEVKSDRSICSFTLGADPLYDGSVFICDAITPSGRRYGCNSDIIKVWYLLADYKNEENKIQESTNCTVRSNLNVQYNWTLKENNEHTFLSANQTISFRQSGIHQCEVDYNIRNVTCSAIVLNVNVDVIQKEEMTTTPPVLVITLSIILVVVIALMLGYLVCFFLKRRRTAYSQSRWKMSKIRTFSKLISHQGDDTTKRKLKLRLSIGCVVVIGLIGLLVYCTLSQKSTNRDLATEIMLSIAMVFFFVLISSYIYFMERVVKTQRRPISVQMKSAIDDNRKSLLKHIDTSQLFNRLKRNRVFDEAQLSFISSKSSPQEKNEALLEILRDCSFISFWMTIGCLHESNQSRAAWILQHSISFGMSMVSSSKAIHDNNDKVSTL